jgi:diaminopimelate decarboxylase
MNHFEYRDHELFCEDVSLKSIAARYGTPAYIYSYATLLRHYKIFDQAFEGLRHITCYSVKANSNICLLNLFARLGGGVDIVSGGELFRSLKAGVPGNRIVFSGVGKTRREMKAAIEADILMFNVESPQELEHLAEVAREAGRPARMALRVNPAVDPKTHPYVATGLRKSKFGIAWDKAVDVYRHAKSLEGLEIVGMACHIGSQLTDTGPFVDAVGRLRGLMERLSEAGIRIRYLDLGGGLGITYDNELPPAPGEYARAIAETMNGLDVTLILEPGRVIVGNAGVLLVEVLYTKEGEDRTFIVSDGAMNDLIRPALYGSYHAIQPVMLSERSFVRADVVGPICESSDFLAQDRTLPDVRSGELLAVMSAGAYGFTMSSNYNSRPRPPEVLVQGENTFLIRRRETHEDLINGEDIPVITESGE